MYPGAYVKQNPSKAAFIMASTGEEVSYQVFDERSNQLAHYLRYEGLKKNRFFANLLLVTMCGTTNALKLAKNI